MIRVRRVRPKLPIGRAYEVEIQHEDGSTETQITRSPRSVLAPTLGVGDLWAVIDAADRNWDGSAGAWASLYEPGSSA